MSRTRLVLLIAMVVSGSRADGQRLWLPADATRNIGFEIGKGFFRTSEFSNNIDFASFAVTIQGRFPVNSKVAVAAAIPLAHVGETSPGFPPYTPPSSQSQTALGNPWIGVEVVSSPGLVIEAGFRPGLAGNDEEALGLGVIDDFDRFEAWLPNVSSGRVMLHVGELPSKGAFVSGIFGGTVAISREGGSPQLYGNYGVRAGFIGSGLLGTVALTGRLFVSNTGASLGDRTVHQLAFGLERSRGSFRPTASIRTYLRSEFRDEVSAILTVGAAFVF